MKQLNILALGAGLSTVLGLTTPALAQSVELIYNNTLPPFNETYQAGIRDFAQDIVEASEGDILVTIPDAELAPPNRQYEAVRDGIVDMALIDISAVSQLVALNGIGELPGNSPSAEAGSVALWETYKEYFEEIGEWEGVKVLATHVLPGRQILSVSDIVAQTPEDLQGARIWATSAPLAAAADAFGGVPMDTAYPELQENVERGNLDVLFITPGSASGAGVRPNVTHVTKIPGGLGTGAFAAIISEERWNELTPEQQDAILEAAEDLPRRLGQANDAEEIATADYFAQIPTTNVEGEALEAFNAVLDEQVQAWMERAREAGLENPEEAMEFYQSVLDRETAE
ncbi:TRAP transporter substrate-binding protein DctP [Pelagibacterium xiamenense]|uniref:TRAP transporter substrate-binding protein DctP n=1 Tax=Pelagibacterium xiamenense TaxID=2901140 RepID=UPI001E33E6CE|nr:TRAP transporter substrate-binding protein DctP [Pelagibacterium xiamenense]MCD7058628.1 TRAP transporter substrate-binding protein DctP [Pelagibacterium xiamenense]